MINLFVSKKKIGTDNVIKRQLAAC